MVEGEVRLSCTPSEFMKLLMPSHVKKVQRLCQIAVPLFQRFGAEDQLAGDVQPGRPAEIAAAIWSSTRPRRLVSIDINSGRSTQASMALSRPPLAPIWKRRSEIARQLRLRDMAGLVVIDFIDMEHGLQRPQG